jgi:hypothetical protein
MSNEGMVRRIRSGWFNSPDLFLNRVAPSLVHDYVNNRYYNTSSGETGFPFTSVRTTNATMFNSNGDLVWAPANMVVNSEAIWTTGLSVATSSLQGTSPQTGANVYKLIANAAVVLTGNDGLGCASLPPVTTNASQTYCLSFYAKAAEVSIARVREPTATGYRALIDLNTGIVTTENGTSGLTSGMLVTTQDAGDGWWRIICRRTASGTSQGFNIKQGNSTGDGVSGILLSSIQFEADDLSVPKKFIATTGTAYYGPRFDFNPNNLQPIGLLVEFSSTNLIVKSSPLTAEWTANFCTVVDNGTKWGQVVSRFTTTSTGSAQFAFGTGNTVTPTAATVHTVSGFVKRGNHPRCQITVSNNHFAPAAFDAYLNYNFDTNTVTLAGTGAVAGTGAATPLSDGWIRLSFNITTGAAPTAGAGFIINCIDSDSAVRLAGTTTNGATVDVFGQQYELNLFTSSLIPTTGVAVTRASDVYSLNPSAYFNATNGTIFVKYFRGYDSFVYTATPLTFSDGSLNNRIQVQTATSISMVHRSGAVNYDYSGVTGTVTSGNLSKMATQYQAVGAKYVGNGAAVISSGTAQAPIGINIMRVGGNPTSSVAKSWIIEIRYYPNDLASDAQLQALTT